MSNQSWPPPGSESWPQQPGNQSWQQPGNQSWPPGGPPYPSYDPGGGPRRRRVWPFVLVAVVVLGLAGGGLVVARNSGSRRSASSSSEHDPTTQPRQPTAPVRNTPQPTHPTQPTQSQSPAGPSARRIAAANTVYATAAMRSVGCRESGSPLDSLQHVTLYYRAIKSCLDRAWPVTIRASGHAFRKPRAVAWRNQIDTPCGAQTGIVSFYCSANETLYLSADEVIQLWQRYPDPLGRLLARMWATHVISHEYGHHVQQLTGILRAKDELVDQTGNSTDLKRRLELQASCLGHVFVGANKNSYPIRRQVRGDWRWRVIQIPDHGSRSNQQFWMERGWETRRAGGCNTFAAAARRVT